MPPAADLTALTAAITAGFNKVTAAIEANQAAVDLAPLTAQVKLVADALYVTTPGLPGQPGDTKKSISQVANESNVQIASVIGEDTAGENRVRVDPDTP